MAISPYMKNILENTDIIHVVEGVLRNTTSSLREYQKKYIHHLVNQNKISIMDDMYTYNGNTNKFYHIETKNNQPYRVYDEANKTSLLIDYNIDDEASYDYLYYDNDKSKLYDISKNTLFFDKYINLVSTNKVKKMMLFLNNHFIRWSRIEVVRDYHYTYLLISGIKKEDITDIKIIYLPKEVKYFEDESRISNKKICFDSDGKLDMTSNKSVIEFIGKDLEVEYFNSISIESKINRAKLTEINFMTFKNGLISNEKLEEINFNTYKVNDNVETFIFWSNLNYSNTEHIDKIQDINLAKSIHDESEDNINKSIINPLDVSFNDIAPKEFIKEVIEEDITDEPDKIQRNIKKVIDYDRTLLNDLVKPETISLVYYGLKLITTAKNNPDEKFIISCPDKSSDSGMLMFVNGELYSLYREIKNKCGHYHIPIDDIKSDDRVEFLFFTNVENLEYPIVPESDAIDISLIDTNNISLLAPYIHPRIVWDSQSFESLSTVKRFFVIGRTIVAITENKIIVFEDRGDVLYQTKKFGGEFIDATFDSSTSSIFVLAKDNIVINYNSNVLRRWAMQLNIEGEIDFIEYANGKIECKAGDKIYTIDNVDENKPSQSSIVKEATGTYIHNPYSDFNGTPYIFVSNYINSYILKQDSNDLSSNENVWYKIPYQKSLSGDKVIIDKKYIGKEIIAFSNKSFKYYGRVIDEPNISGVILPKEFSYCKNWDQFMVFINGRRLDQNAYAITTMKNGNPFVHTAVFPAIPLEYNDRVDIFYLPRRLEDISTQATISASGYIKVDHTLLPYGFNENTCLIFLNGKKINFDITKDVHFYKIKLNENIGSLDHLNIVKYIFNDTYSRLLQSTPSEWDVLMEKVPSVQINQLMNYNNEVYDSPENLFNEYQATIKTPVYEILYHYFLADPNSVADIQLYDFIDAGFDLAPNNMMIPGVFDASLQDKFKPI